RHRRADAARPALAPRRPLACGHWRRMMSGINRRDVFAGAGGVFAAWLTRRRASAAVAIPPAPVARVAVVKDTYFGETLSDPYRWMENDKDPDWLPFLRGQNEHARALLNTIPGRDRLLKRIQQLSGDAAATLLVQRAGGRLFYQQRPAGADNFKLFVREDGGASRVLIDPPLLSSATSHLSLDWWRASPDGSHVVYGVSKLGSEDSILHVRGLASGRRCSGQPGAVDGGGGLRGRDHRHRDRWRNALSAGQQGPSARPHPQDGNQRALGRERDRGGPRSRHGHPRHWTRPGRPVPSYDRW